MKLIVGDLDDCIAEALGRHAHQRLENTAEMPGNKQAAAFPRREKVIAVKHEVDDRLPNPDKMNIIHNGVPGILAEDLTKIRLVVIQCLGKSVQREIFCEMVFDIMQDLAGRGRKAGGVNKV